jgi:pSer/pThr/pTyr-binding forkhead associated (FHA) protein
MIENESLSDLETMEPEAPVDEAVVEAPVTAAPRATLTLKRSGVESEHVFEFGSPATVGRFDPAVGPIDVDLGPLEEGVYVSRKHARLVCEDGVWRVEDLGSSNGTFVLRSDFEKVDSAELADGDEISFGNARLVFHVAGKNSSLEPDTDESGVGGEEAVAPQPEGL